MAHVAASRSLSETWGAKSLPADGSAPIDAPFWTAAIARVRKRAPGFVFIAEVYWDLEWTLQQQGFDTRTTSGFTIGCASAMRTAVRGICRDWEYSEKVSAVSRKSTMSCESPTPFPSTCTGLRR